MNNYWAQFDKSELDEMHGITCDSCDNTCDYEAEEIDKDDPYIEYPCCGGRGCNTCYMVD